MHCPFCAHIDTRVIDSRLLGEGDQIRRRRECMSCKARFTTYETAELSLPRVIKSDGRRETFNDDKLRGGMKKKGVIVSGGQEQLKGKIFRIGTMGVCSSGDLLRTIQTLELILLKEGNIHSCGVGVEAMSRVLDS